MNANVLQYYSFGVAIFVSSWSVVEGGKGVEAKIS